MPLSSDLTINAAKFAPDTIDPETCAFNEKLIKIWADGPRWYEVGAPTYRRLRWEGKTPLPKPVVLPHGLNGTIPSRDPNRTIPFRVFKPRGKDARGVFLHIHGGGWVLQSEAYQDPYLAYMADNYELAVFSVGYRLAPEDPWPAGAEDCFDAAKWLIANAPAHYGGPLLFAGGESAGAHLALLTCLHLLDTQPGFAFRGLLLHFGCYDLSLFLPHVVHHDAHLVIDHDVMASYIRALLPGTSVEDRRDPSISPFFADLRGRALPAALFTAGSEDPLVEDSVCMAARWGMWGHEAVLRVYHGAPHGFIAFVPGVIGAVQEGLDDSVVFVRERMGERV